MPLNPDRACDHPIFTADCQVSRLEDVGRFSLSVWVRCGLCEEPFVFPDGIPIGVELAGISRDVSGQELRVAVRPALSTEELTHRGGQGAE